MLSDNNSMHEFQKIKRDDMSETWITEFSDIVGKENILKKFSECLPYGRDRSPYSTLKYRFGKLPSVLPTLVVSPKSYEEISKILVVSNQYKIPIVPYGCGSGVMGGALPVKNGITVDLKNMNKVIDLDRISCTVTTQTGINGELFEAMLNKERLTLGHFPQSLNMSTVGGWLACRSAGQASSRYRAIEDMVIGLKVIIPDGRLLEVKPAPRRAVGPSIKDLFIGSEGTLGIIVEATFRVWPYPQKESVHAIGFNDYLNGLEAIRKIMQSEVRPAVIRLYDENESKSKIASYPEYKNYPCICFLIFQGLNELVEVEKTISLEYCNKAGGIEGNKEPAYEWMQHRYHSFSAAKVYSGRIMDTIEVASTWTNLPNLYEAFQEAVNSEDNKDTCFGAHWSHFYPDGACMYMTFDMPVTKLEQTALKHKMIWNKVMEACLNAGGTISHHHGIGSFRNDWIKQEIGLGHDILSALKNILDPNKIMNPGKLSLV